ncbi:Cadherin-like beta sandwich domain protein [compost metagenome]
MAANAADDLSSIFITGNQTTSDTIALTAGKTTTIPIVVTAQDGGKKTYTVTVTVPAANIAVTGVNLDKNALTLTAGGAVAVEVGITTLPLQVTPEPLPFWLVRMKEGNK